MERQPIVFGQPPEWYTKFEEIRNQRRLDKVMPPVNKIAESIFNDNEEELVQEDKDAMVFPFHFVNRCRKSKNCVKQILRILHLRIRPMIAPPCYVILLDSYTFLFTPLLDGPSLPSSLLKRNIKQHVLYTCRIQFIR